MKIKALLATLQNLTKYKITQEELGKALGVKKSAISLRIKTQEEENKGQLKKDEIEKIANYFNVNPHLLIWTSCDSETYTSDNGFIDIPVRGEVEASMGYGVTVLDETQTATYSISRKLAKDLNICLSSSEIIFARGNSMLPTIEGGDSLLIDLSKKDIYDGKIYCIRYDGQL